MTLVVEHLAGAHQQHASQQHGQWLEKVDTPEECAAATSVLAGALGLTVQDISRLCRDRNGRLVRVYLTVALEQAALPDCTSADDGERLHGGGR